MKTARTRPEAARMLKSQAVRRKKSVKIDRRVWNIDVITTNIITPVSISISTIPDGRYRLYMFGHCAHWESEASIFDRFLFGFSYKYAIITSIIFKTNQPQINPVSALSIQWLTRPESRLWSSHLGVPLAPRWSAHRTWQAWPWQYDDHHIWGLFRAELLMEPGHHHDGDNT